MSGIPLFKEIGKGFTICDQGYTIRQSESYRILHAENRWCAIALALALAWFVIGTAGLVLGLWYNLPAVVLVSLVFLALMAWVFYPRKRKGGPKGPPGDGRTVQLLFTIQAPPASLPAPPSSPTPPSAS